MEADSRRHRTTLFLLSLIQFTEGWLGTVVVPLLPLMVQQFPFDPTLSLDDTRYSNNIKVGLIGSAFFLAAMASAVFWGWLSDRFGRRPTLLFGVAGSAFGIFLFGCSRNFGSALFAYTLTGSFSSSICITKSFIAEITSGREQAQAFASICLMYGLAQLVAPFLGGVLAGVTSVDLLGLTDLPYAFLVSLTSCVIVLLTLIVCWIWLPESPAFIVGRSDDAKRVEMVALGASEHPVTDANVPVAAFRFNMDLITMIFNYGVLALIEIANTELLAIFCEASKSSGGLDLSGRDVGIIFAIEGVVLIVYQGLIYRLIMKYFSALDCMRISSLLMIMLVPLPWFGKFFSTSGAVFGFLSLVLSLRTIPEATAYTSANILIADASPDHMRGLINGFASAAASAGRAAAPLMTSLVWAQFSARGVCWVPFLLLSNCAILLTISTWTLGVSLQKKQSQDPYKEATVHEEKDCSTEPLVSIQL